MKTSKSFATIKCLVLVAIAVLITTACNNQPTEQTAADPAKEASEENDIKFDNKKLEKDAQFLVDASAFNLEQIHPCYQLYNLS